MESTNRRSFLKGSLAAAGAGALAIGGGDQLFAGVAADNWFDISLAEWSLHRSIRAGKVDNKDFAKVAKEEFGISAIEYVNQFFKDKARDEAYLGELKTRAEDHGVKTLLIMIDGEGRLGDPNDAGPVSYTHLTLPTKA